MAVYLIFSVENENILSFKKFNVDYFFIFSVEKLGEGEYGEVKKGKLTKKDRKGKRHTVNIYYSTLYNIS